MKHILFLLISVFFFITDGFSSDQTQPGFIENKGQWKGSFIYKYSNGNNTIFLNKTGYTLSSYDRMGYEKLQDAFHGEGLIDPHGIQIKSHSYEMSFVNADSSNFWVDLKSKTDNSYYIFNDLSSTKNESFSTYSSVVQKNIYSGIDIKYYTDNNKFKYDFIVKPFIDPNIIQFKYEGADRLYLKNGSLVISTSVGEFVESKPFAYQIIDNKKVEVECNFQIDNGTVSFLTGVYDKKYALVIDPVLIFSTYSGSKSSNWGFCATPGPDGSLFAAGIVFGTGYPVSLGALQSSFSGGTGQGTINGVDISITRFSADGRTRLYSTYLGGSGDEFPSSMISDSEGNLFILGRTSSLNFPTLNRIGALGGTDIFISKLSADGNRLLGGVLIGGTGMDGANIDASMNPGPKSLLYGYGDNSRGDLILDKNNNLFVVSQTQSVDFPTKNSTQAYGGNQEGVVMKFSNDLSSQLFSTFLGGNGDDAAFVLALNPLNNNIYVGGATASNNFPGINLGTIGTAYQGNIDGFVSIFSNNGLLLGSTFLATTAADLIYGIQSDKNGFIYISAITTGNWPTYNASFSNPGAKQVIAKLKPDLSDYVYSTTYGKASTVPNIITTAFYVDKDENVYVSGWGGKLNNCYNGAYDTRVSGTVGMPVTANALQNYTDGKDIYLFVMEKDAKSQLYGSYFGQQGGEGDHVDGGLSRFDSTGTLYQAICANCGGTNVCPQDPITKRMIITPSVVAPINGALGSGSAGGCNLAALKINLINSSTIITATIDLANDNYIKIFPNPVTDYLVVNLKKPEFNAYYFYLYDQFGRILENLIIKEKSVINFKNYSKGVFGIKIIDKSGKLIYTNKIVKH